MSFGLGRLREASDVLHVARSMFEQLAGHNVRRMILGNSFDDGMGVHRDALRELSQRAHEFGHHLIVVYQSKHGAGEIERRPRIPERERQ